MFPPSPNTQGAGDTNQSTASAEDKGDNAEENKVQWVSSCHGNSKIP